MSWEAFYFNIPRLQTHNLSNLVILALSAQCRPSIPSVTCRLERHHLTASIIGHVRVPSGLPRHREFIGVGARKLKLKIQKWSEETRTHTKQVL